KGDVILNELYKRDIYSVLIEGGGKTLGRFFYDNLIDRVFAFVCPMVFGGSSAPTPACSEGILDIKDARKFRLESSQRIDDDMFLIYNSIDYDKCINEWLEKQKHYCGSAV
ncbi:MAG: dihydrofolate reductase family protein, partial [Candidatus Hydrogenedentota bacterium]